MSEYQYYEFLALDQPLTDEQYEQVRALSTRAEITRTRFVNEYQWGDFRGNPSALMDLCYDAHLYFANWGTRILMLRLPLSLLDIETTAEYCNDETFSSRRSDENIVLEFHSEDEGGEGWEEGWPSLASLIGIRAELAAGDLRALYLAWLAGVWFDGAEADADDALEPPVPAGLGQLTASQRALADLLRVDRDMLDAASSASDRIAEASHVGLDAAVDSWIRGLTTKQKDEALRRLLSDDHPKTRAEMLRAARPRNFGVSAAPRTLASLVAAASERAALRESARQQELDRQRALREEEARHQWESRLALLSDRGERPWADVADLIAAKKPTSYDSAVRLLTDLAELSRRRGTSARFAERLAELRSTHQRKPSLIERLDAADLP
ncbi:hypothetical protein ABH926_004638 [Catenulispora sp. GP43]|uniref:hypothetical protein n=1 Tax=Catenulispora sp. GP43 TaxID=3156263 RepID=UPI0035156AB2